MAAPTHTASTGPGPGVDAPAGEGGHYLTFLLGDGLFATDIRSVREIIQHGPMTAMPLMPHFVRGVINLRGAVVPVIDMNARFGREASAVSRRSCTVIVEVRSEDGPQDIGIMVDAVSAVLDIPAADIEPPPSFGARIRAEFLQGMGKVGGRFVMILNMAQVLSVDELAHLGEALGAAA